MALILNMIRVIRVISAQIRGSGSIWWESSDGSRFPCFDKLHGLSASIPVLNEGILRLFGDGKLSFPCCRTIVIPSMPRLPCLHHGCPQMFKSQHGRTYHMRAVHLNTNSRPINVDRNRSQSPQSSNDDRLAPTANERGPASKRVEHPRLTGMYCYTVLLNHSLILGRNISTSMQPRRWFLATRHTSITPGNSYGRGLDAFPQ